MPKFKRLPKSSKPFKFELEEDFTITPRFDKGYWKSKDGFSIYDKDVDHFESIGSMLKYSSFYEDIKPKILVTINQGEIIYKAKGKSNGLTCHRDHSWALTAAYSHDVLLLEGYREVHYKKLERAIIDRVFLSVLLDHVDTLTGFKKRLYKSFAYAMYWAVCANSIIRG